jgi:hypothetical protein
MFSELEEAYYHIAEMSSSPHTVCKEPKPTVVYVEDPLKQNRQFYPECTVVYRCRSDSACCGRHAECGPKAEQEIFRSFLVSVLAYFEVAW